MGRRVLVAGVGMVPFAKPGAAKAYDEMGAGAVEAVLADSGLSYDKIQQVYAGYVYGDSTCGQRVVYRFGMTRIPVLNVNNNCASGSSALWLARQAVESGAVECALAVGFEQMPPGALGAKWTDRPNPLTDFSTALRDVYEVDPDLPMTPQYFAAGRRRLHGQVRHEAGDLRPGLGEGAPATRRTTPTPSSVTRSPWTRSSAAPGSRVP